VTGADEQEPSLSATKRLKTHLTGRADDSIGDGSIATSAARLEAHWRGRFWSTAGVDPSKIARRAGHSSVSFTYDLYGHLFPEVDDGAAAKLDAIRTGLASVVHG
jgi:integrase